MAETIRIRVLLFAMLAEAAGERQKELQLPAGATVAEAAAALFESNPAMAKLPSTHILFAVNEKYADPDVQLEDGDELALIPPVSGGSESVSGSDSGTGSGDDVSRAGESGGARAAAVDSGAVCADGSDVGAVSADGRFALTLAPLSSEAVAALVGGAEFGALCTFVGTVRGVTRTEAGLRQTELLEYEAYPPMVVAEMERIAADIRRRWPDVEVAMHHRFGKVSVGEAAVVIVAAAPHRDNAFAACRFGIDELKRRCPIWKKEYYTDGTVAWGAPEPD